MTNYIGLSNIYVSMWNKMLIVYSFNDKLYCVHIISIHIHCVYMSANVKFKTNKIALGQLSMRLFSYFNGISWQKFYFKNHLELAFAVSLDQGSCMSVTGGGHPEKMLTRLCELLIECLFFSAYLT